REALDGFADRLGHGLKVTGDMDRRGKVGETENGVQPGLDRGPLGRIVQRDPDATGQALDMAVGDTAEGFAEIPHEPVNKEGTVASLQRELMVVRDDVMHGGSVPRRLQVPLAV